MDVKLALDVTLLLTKEEFRLVTMGLTGHLPKRDQAAAKELGIRILNAQGAALEERSDLTRGALAKLEQEE